MAAKRSIPVIDLLVFPNQLSKLISACEEWGSFRLLNYQQVLSVTLMSDMKVVVESLSDLPVEIKCQNHDTIAWGGYITPTTNNPFFESLGLRCP